MPDDLANWASQFVANRQVERDIANLRKQRAELEIEVKPLESATRDSDLRTLNESDLKRQIQWYGDQIDFGEGYTDHDVKQLEQEQADNQTLLDNLIALLQLEETVRDLEAYGDILQTLALVSAPDNRQLIHAYENMRDKETELASLDRQIAGYADRQKRLYAPLVEVIDRLSTHVNGPKVEKTFENLFFNKPDLIPKFISNLPDAAQQVIVRLEEEYSKLSGDQYSLNQELSRLQQEIDDLYQQIRAKEHPDIGVDSWLESMRKAYSPKPDIYATVVEESSGSRVLLFERPDKLFDELKNLLELRKQLLNVVESELPKHLGGLS